jgi:hypothetical protein
VRPRYDKLTITNCSKISEPLALYLIVRNFSRDSFVLLIFLFQRLIDSNPTSSYDVNVGVRIGQQIFYLASEGSNSTLT